MKRKHLSVVIKYADGSVSDKALNEEILASVDDTPLRIRLARRAMALGLT